MHDIIENFRAHSYRPKLIDMFFKPKGFSKKLTKFKHKDPEFIAEYRMMVSGLDFLDKRIAEFIIDKKSNRSYNVSKMEQIVRLIEDFEMQYTHLTLKYT